MIRRPPRSTPLYSSAASDVYKRQHWSQAIVGMLAPSVGFHRFVLSALSTCLHCPPPLDCLHTLHTLIASSPLESTQPLQDAPTSCAFASLVLFNIDAPPIAHGATHSPADSTV